MSATAKAETKKMVTAVFQDRLHAEAAYDYLFRKAYSPTEINVLMSDHTRSKYYSSKEDPKPIESGTHMAEGIAAGGTIGTAIGAAVGIVAALGTSIVVPGLGLIVAGPIVAGLAGGGAGAVTGGLIGGLVGLGIPESNAKAYEKALKEGGIAVGVVPHSSDDNSAIAKEFKKLHGDNIVTA
jgi:hypothetical protein